MSNTMSIVESIRGAGERGEKGGDGVVTIRGN
jgi:hypothetical protein